MYTSFYSMPMERNFMYPRRRNFNFNNNRLFGSGFAIPFLLGGITGAALNNQAFYPNNFYYNNYYPYYYYY